MLEDIYVNTLTCRFGSCGAPAVRWYLRTDLDAERLVIYPTCFAHAERAEAETCGDGCLAPLEDHYLSRHDDLVPQLEAALLEHSYGVGFPTRRNPDLIDVIRPRVL